MSSSSTPWRANDHSPARQTRRTDAHVVANARSSPRRGVSDSPSRQLLQDLQKLHLDNDRKLQNHLDERVAEEKRRHDLQLAESAAYHERIRQSAERECELNALEAERVRKQQEAEELEVLEKARRARLVREDQERQQQRDRLLREQEERHKREAEEREFQESQTRLEEQRKREAAEAEERRHKEQEDAKAKAKAAADAAKSRLEAQKPATPAPDPAPAATTPSQSTTAAPKAQTVPPPATNGDTASSLKQDRERLHKRYLELHQNMKKMREFVVTEGKKIPALKTKIGDWRREITKSMGQLTTDKVQNRDAMKRIMDILQESQKYPQPSVDASSYLISQPAPSTPCPVSGLFIYLMNIFSKCVIRQFLSESSGGIKAADPIAVVAVTIFASPATKLNQTIPLIDLLLAKYHVTCPVVFGISGPSNTAAGRARLGWWKEDGAWVGEQRHNERMTGLATGFAALTLRAFAKSRYESPLWNTNYWHAMACIVNVPTEALQPTHFTVLKGLIDGSVQRFIGFYGFAAVALLRTAMVDLPARAKTRGDRNLALAADGMVVLREVLRRDLKLTLE